MRCFGIFAAMAAVVACHPVLAQDQIRWQPNLEAAQRLASQSNRLVLVHFWAPWCPPCMQLEREVFTQAQLGTALDASYVCVKVNVDEAPATAKKFGVSKIPTDVVITPTGQLVSQSASPNTAAQYVAQCNRIAEGHKQLKASPAQSNAAMLASASKPATPSSAGGVYSDQQYAQYLNKGAAQSGSSPAPPAAQPAPEQCNLDYQQALQGQVAAGRPQQPAQQQPLMNQFPRYAQGGNAMNPPVQQPGNTVGRPAAPTSAVQLPAGCPPLGMDGQCPVTMLLTKQWVPGDRRWGAIHRGRTYLFAGPEQQKQFLTDPDRFSPTLSGDDPVAALDGRQAVPGRREHGLIYQQHIYLFSSEDTLKRFSDNPGRYATEVQQAMRSTTLR